MSDTPMSDLRRGNEFVNGGRRYLVTRDIRSHPQRWLDVHDLTTDQPGCFTRTDPDGSPLGRRTVELVAMAD